MQRIAVRPAREGSYERLFHESDVPTFTLHLRAPQRPDLREELISPRLEREIGVVYLPETERTSQYFYASLPHQFDEIIWFDESHAVRPVEAPRRSREDLPETYPFGL